MDDRLKNWQIENVAEDTMTFAKCVSSETGQRLTFVVSGCDTEDDYDEDTAGYRGTYGKFKSFTIDGREPTDDEADEHSDDLRRLIREVILA